MTQSTTRSTSAGVHPIAGSIDTSSVGAARSAAHRRPAAVWLSSIQAAGRSPTNAATAGTLSSRSTGRHARLACRPVEAARPGREAIFGATVAARLTQFFASGAEHTATPFPDLTSRERDILALLATGANNATIAARLGLTEKTVRNNVSNVFAKLRVADRAAAVARARDGGLGSP